jgi:opacity protein-like surface antigen
MKRWILLLWISLICQYGYSQNVGLKSNLLYDATSTINLGIEFALADKWTIDVSGNLNPWAFPQQKVNSSGRVVEEHDAIIQHWMVQPELRYWLCEKFNGHYVGMNLAGGKFNVGGLSFLPDNWGKNGIQMKRFDGWMAGAGVSYGYHLILTNRISLEFSLGLGYEYLKYEKYNNYADTKPTEKDPQRYKMHYFGVTKAGISLVFMLN